MKNKDNKWKKRKEYIDDPDKPRAYLVSFAGWMPNDRLKND